MPSLQIQAAPDHLRRLIGKSPVRGLTELIWNSLDAEAQTVEVSVDLTEAGAIDRVRIIDDGHGFSADEVGALFDTVGGSWKQASANRKTRSGLRELHGRKGEGRWKALAIGDSVRWESVTESAGWNQLATLSMRSETPDKAEWTGPTSTVASRGTQVTITAGMSEPKALLKADLANRLVGQFGLYLTRYPGISVRYRGERLDPEELQKSVDRYQLSSGSEFGPAELTIIEWSVEVPRELCLCDGSGATLHHLEPGIQAKDFQFTAYVSWDGFRHHESVLELAELDSPDLRYVLAEARDTMRKHFRDKRAAGRSSVLDAWRLEDVYPFTDGEGEDVEEATKALFNYVAVTASDAVNSIEDPTAKKLSLQTIRVALESDPGSLERVIQEVLNLPPAKVDEFRELLEKTSLTAILSTSRMVASRLEMVQGLEMLLFDPAIRGTVLERAHIHKIIGDAPWLFGEEYATHVSDQSLTSLLKAHVSLLGRPELLDAEPVLDVDGDDRRVDFMFGRATELNQNKREHLVLEIKRPIVKIGRKESDQIEDYARAVAADTRFDRDSTDWVFVVVGVEIKDELKGRVQRAGEPKGLFLKPEGENYQVWIRTWGEVLGECKHRLKFVRKELAYDPSQDQALTFLRSTYPDFLPSSLRADPDAGSGPGHAQDTPE